MPWEQTVVTEFDLALSVHDREFCPTSVLHRPSDPLTDDAYDQGPEEQNDPDHGQPRQALEDEHNNRQDRPYDQQKSLR